MEEARLSDALQAWSSLLGPWRARDIGYTPDRVWEIAGHRGELFVLKEIRYDFERWQSTPSSERSTSSSPSPDR